MIDASTGFPSTRRSLAAPISCTAISLQTIAALDNLVQWTRLRAANPTHHPNVVLK